MSKYSLLSINILLLICTVGNSNAAYSGPLLLYSTNKDIRIVNASRGSHNKFKSSIILRNLTNSQSIDYHFKAKKLCWSASKRLQCTYFAGIESPKSVQKAESVAADVFSPGGLACEWFTGKLYWTDDDANRIEVVTMDGKYRKVLFWTDIDQPRAIAVAPMRGLMFWTDWGEMAKIERASLDGDPKTRKVIVSSGLFWPNGLTIDYSTETIWWIDGKLRFLESMNYDGSSRSVRLGSQFEYPFALTVIQHRLFWTDWKTWSIHSYDRHSNESRELIHLSDTVPMDIRVFDVNRQPPDTASNNPCRNETLCSHLCLLSSVAPYYSCACPIGVKLIDKHNCAAGPEQLLLLARRTHIYLIYLDSPDFTYKMLPLVGLLNTVAVDYDPVDGYMYWTDDAIKKIQRARLDGSDQSDVIADEIQYPDGIAIDFISRNMYWADTGTDRVEMCRMQTGYHYRIVIISEDLGEPRAVAVASQLGWLFWSDWNAKSPKIERSNLDGTDRIPLVIEGLEWPNGLTLDLTLQRIYWCDARFDRIEYANMDGTDRHELISTEVPHVFGFTLLGDYLYWSDWQRQSVERALKSDGTHRQVIVDQLNSLMGVKAVHLGHTIKKGENACGDNNGNCTQMCFYRPHITHGPDGKQRLCACQLGYELDADRKTCIRAEEFLLYAKRDQIGRISLTRHNNEMAIPVSGLKQTSAIDFEVQSERIFWADSKLRTIQRSHSNGSMVERVVELGLVQPEDLAVDWIGMNVFWTDSMAHRIEVARLNGKSRRTLIWGEINEPHSIALDPHFGYIYWTEWGNGISANALKKAYMNGQHVSKILVTNGQANYLTVDTKDARLFWTEVDTIFSCDIHGNDRTIHVRSEKLRIIGLSFYQNALYWFDDNSGNILRADKRNPANYSRVDIIKNGEGNVTDLVAFHMDRVMNGVHKCMINNGDCTHLCIPVPAQPDQLSSHICACATHYSLVDNKCIPPEEFIIYVQRNLAVRLLPDTQECPEAVLPIHGLKNVRAIDFDSMHNFLYWIEGNKLPVIKRADVNTGEISLVVGVDHRSSHDNNSTGISPFDLSVDTIGRLLFWTCSQRNVINVTRLDNSMAFGVVVQKEKEKPRLLAIHPTKRLLFYTDIGVTPQLVRVRLDGSHRLMITKASDIAAIAIDAENDLIVWTQGHSIYISNIDGENQHVLLNEAAAKITQLTIHTGWLYWIDRELNQLQRLELISGKSRSTIPIYSSNYIVDMVSVSIEGSTTQKFGVLQPDMQYRNHSCAVKKHKCSHLCIMNGTYSVICACPVGSELADDKRTCVARPPSCGPDQFTCGHSLTSSGGNCIPLTWRCDGQQECADGSDELDCPSAAHCHGPDQFRCSDGNECITAQHVCDGAPHCHDQSDEAHCCLDGFQCPNTDTCLPMHMVCDRTQNCADGADEDVAYCSQPSVYQKGQIKSWNNGYSTDSVASESQNSNIIGAAIGVLMLFIIFAIFIYYTIYRKKQHQRSVLCCPSATTAVSGPDDGIVCMSGTSTVGILNVGGVLSGSSRPMTGPISGATGTSSECDDDWLPLRGAHNRLLQMKCVESGGSEVTYERNQITCASSSTTNGSSLLCYPRETVNPPPSPATTRGSSSVSRYKPYRHYRTINQPPPPTPCSTDVCDESDYNYPISRSRMGGGSFPPPPTPRSHCQSESCPPSPSSRSSTYFSPFPPPPSPAFG